MGSIKKVTPDSAFTDCTAGIKPMLETRCIKAFTYVGEACLIEARTNGNYQDRTGNLRNSIGYTVLKDGKTVTESGFSQTEGGAQGEKLISSLKKKYPTGIVLIVSAGMKYAACVEARNYNVITSAELLAEKLVPQILTQIGFELK